MWDMSALSLCASSHPPPVTVVWVTPLSSAAIGAGTHPQVYTLHLHAYSRGSAAYSRGSAVSLLPHSACRWPSALLPFLVLLPASPLRPAFHSLEGID